MIADVVQEVAEDVIERHCGHDVDEEHALDILQPNIFDCDDLFSRLRILEGGPEIEYDVNEKQEVDAVVHVVDPL